VKLETFNSLVLSADLYACATWIPTAAELDTLDKAVNRMLCRMVTGADMLSSIEDMIIMAAELRNNVIIPLAVRVACHSLRYVGRVARMPNGSLQRLMMNGEVLAGACKNGGQGKSNQRVNDDYMRSCGIDAAQWLAVATDPG
jgi:hypothetical protein